MALNLHFDGVDAQQRDGMGADNHVAAMLGQSTKDSTRSPSGPLK